VTTQEDQTDILDGTTPALGETRSVGLEAIEDDGTAAPSWLLASIRQLGLWQPVALIAPPRARLTLGAEDEMPRYAIHSGRRRIACARALGWERIPALVFPAGISRAVVDAATLATNMVRKRNPADELDALDRLIADAVRDGRNPTDSALAVAIGTTIPAVRKLREMLGLSGRLRDALREGKMAPGVAAAAARLPFDAQIRIGNKLAQQPRILHADIREERNLADTMESLVLDAPPPTFAPDRPSATPWAALRGRLEHLVSSAEHTAAVVAHDATESERELATALLAVALEAHTILEALPEYETKATRAAKRKRPAAKAAP
jgi:ParB-like chromosome segregation protein Spo0J